MEPTSPESWQVPLWHPDFGDARGELEQLRSVALSLLSIEPRAVLRLEQPEEGLMYIRGEHPEGPAFEVYVTHEAATSGGRHLAVFVYPEPGNEIEGNCESVESAVEFLLRHRRGYHY